MIVTVFLAAAVACTSGPTDDPCPWLTGDNCWKAQVAEATACAHDESTVGALSADGTTCTFDDGVVITFQHPLDLADDQPDVWQFSIAKDGVACLAFEQDDGDTSTYVELTTPLGTFVEDAGRASVDVTCPDASTFSFSPLAMLNCDAFGSMPGISWSVGAEVFFDLLGGADGHVPLFTCRAP